MTPRQREALELSNDGLTINQIADELGLSESGVRSLERRGGFKGIRVCEIDHRHIVLDMKSSDAIEYLLDVIDQIRPSLDTEHEIDGYHVNLTSSERALSISLYDNMDRVLRKDQLLDYIYAGKNPDREPDVKIIDVFVCKARKKIKGTDLGISTVWGQGYRMTRVGQ